MSDNTAILLDAVLPELKAGNKKQAFQIIAEYAATKSGLPQSELLHKLSLQDRAVSCSGIGEGVSLLHVLETKTDKPFIMLGRCKQPIEYDSVDGKPVDIFVLLISPESEGPYHLQRLARISRIFRDKDLCRNIRHADSVDAIKALFFDTSLQSVAA